MPSTRAATPEDLQSRKCPSPSWKMGRPCAARRLGRDARRHPNAFSVIEHRRAAFRRALGLSGLRWEQAEPLYDELLGQIYRVPNPHKPDDAIRLTPQNLDAHVEDVGTIYRLRWEAIAVCLDFLHGGEGLTSRLSQILNPSGSGTTQTSPDASASR
ncbi:MAG: hypothetical protein ACLR7Z_10570 [Bilophila wadsworthia]